MSVDVFGREQDDPYEARTRALDVLYAARPTGGGSTVTVTGTDQFGSEVTEVLRGRDEDLEDRRFYRLYDLKKVMKELVPNTIPNFAALTRPRRLDEPGIFNPTEWLPTTPDVPSFMAIKQQEMDDVMRRLTQAMDKAYWGQQLPEPWQTRLDEVNKVIADAQDLMARPRIWVDDKRPAAYRVGGVKQLVLPDGESDAPAVAFQSDDTMDFLLDHSTWSLPDDPLRELRRVVEDDHLPTYVVKSVDAVSGVINLGQWLPPDPEFAVDVFGRRAV